MCDGAYRYTYAVLWRSDCVRLVLQTLLRGSNDAILLPQPGRPELAAIVALLGGTAVGYQLEGECLLEAGKVRSGLTYNL